MLVRGRTFKMAPTNYRVYTKLVINALHRVKKSDRFRPLWGPRGVWPATLAQRISDPKAAAALERSPTSRSSCTICTGATLVVSRRRSSRRRAAASWSRPLSIRRTSGTTMPTRSVCCVSWSRACRGPARRTCWCSFCAVVWYRRPRATLAGAWLWPARSAHLRRSLARGTAAPKASRSRSRCNETRNCSSCCSRSEDCI